MHTAEPEDVPGAAMTTNTKSLNLNVEAWQLILAVFAVLAGSYYFAWDSHKTLLTEIAGMRNQMEAGRKDSDEKLEKFFNELKADRIEENRQAREDKKTLDDKLQEIHDAQIITAEALKKKK